MTRSTRLWLVTALAAALLAATVSPAHAQSPKRGGVFRVPAPDAVSLDPHINAGFGTQIYASLVYGHLVRFPAGHEATGSGDHRILPDLAEKWESPNPTTIVFTLRKGVRFHKKPPVNGREVTAEDVKYSLERFRARSPARHRLEPVQSIDVLDRYTVKLVLREPFAPLLNHLASPAHCAIVPRELDEKFKDRVQSEAVIGTGPFVLKSYERGVRAVFERNPDYHLPGLPYLDAVSVEIVPDAAARLALLRAGKLELAHWWGWLTPEEGRALKRTNPEMVVPTQMVVDLAHIFMRTDQPPFNDVRVRRAVSLAIDRKAWRESLHYGEGCLDSGPVPCAMTEWKLDAGRLEPARRKYLDGYDPAEARRLLAEAGFPRGFTAPMFYWPGYAPPWRSYYDLVADSLAKIGIAVELKAEEAGRYSTMTFLGKFEKMAMGPFGAGETEVDNFLYETFFSGSLRNRSHVADAELDRMLLAQRRELDPVKRHEIVQEIQRYLADKAYYVYLPMWPRYIAHPPYVKGFKHIDGYGLGTRLMYVWLDR
ncbi:MAG TPA: ABC transporter substrate-binding protein [Methylomirabilota bacterium]|nr:ABC transporter substrate-binding protein [Methylomirabilota bacterium]